jgi:hypothetical protein
MFLQNEDFLKVFNQCLGCESYLSSEISYLNVDFDALVASFGLLIAELPLLTAILKKCCNFISQLLVLCLRL